MKSVNTIAILLTCYNRREKTLTCLTSLYAVPFSNSYKFEVFLVDDGSTDGTGEAVKNMFPDVNVIQGNGHLYWNRGMHLAWETAANKEDFDYFLWLNDDVELFNNAIPEMLETSVKEPEAIISGTMVSKLTNQITYGGFNDRDQLLQPNGCPQVCKKFHGNLVLIPRNVYNKVGNLDPKYPHAIGDFDYALRANRNGIKSLIAPTASGICEVHEKLPDWCLPEIPLKKRFRTLYSPLGNSHPRYFFYFEKKHYGILVAFKHLVTIHTRALFPKLWK
ncbi:glycosyltransferase family 2 protein [Saccharicrinis sp. FJH62]|uniref:glycosyltransferase family 2 protein n=1 Tax=Saccharicrinis sp. FJH62 TaxID=3344657 RepID=UPI0035D46873